MASSVTEEGKDQAICVKREDDQILGKVEHLEDQIPSKAEPLEEKSDSSNMEGLILPTGEINWACPCLGGMATGPCGAEFRAAFSCFHLSRTEVRGEDCSQPLREMQACFRNFPHVYTSQADEEEKRGEENSHIMQEQNQPPPSSIPPDTTTDPPPIIPPDTTIEPPPPHNPT